MQISEQILSMKDDCVKIRRDLHRIHKADNRSMPPR